MGLFARIFGTDQAIAGTIDAVKNGLDALVYTDEEKAVDAAKDRAEARSMVVDWMKSTSGQNLARRWLAVAITSVWLGQYVVAQLFAIVAVFATAPAKYSTAAGVMADYAERMNGAVMLILAFYFAAPHMSQIVDVAMQKFGKPTTKTGD